MKYSLLTAAAASVVSVFSAPTAMATASDNMRDAISDVQHYSVLDSKQKLQYSAIFTAIQNARWDEAARLIDAAPKGPMAAMARAELYLAPNSPVVNAEQLQALLSAAPYLPQAERIEKLALKRGVTTFTNRPGIQRFSYLGSAPRRDLPDNIDVAGISDIRNAIQINIRNDDPAGAEALVESKSAMLSYDALTELRYRIAWSYYIENDDGNARRLAGIARSGGGDWAVQANWVYGLANWRLKEYKIAYEAFDVVGKRANNDDLRSAGLFWSARAATASRQPQMVQVRLQNAARLPETFYGLLASEALGMEPLARKQVRNTKLDWPALKSQENVQIAVGLAEIGQSMLADDVIKFQARIGDPKKHGDLAKLAGALNLPATQLWMGHYGPSSIDSDAMARYPAPSWSPQGGWRVDSSLVYAHALQESAFRTSVISTAGARGLMQVRPGTAGDVARARGVSFSASDLDQPTINLEYGQTYIEQLRDMSATGGLLPKVIAAYNAGPSPIARWNSEIRDNGDPLLYIESIPYWETRGYVEIILRNYWMYEIQRGKNGGSMTGLAQYLWPRFPSVNGTSVAVRNNGGPNGGR